MLEQRKVVKKAWRQLCQLISPESDFSQWDFQPIESSWLQDAQIAEWNDNWKKALKKNSKTFLI